MEGEESNKTLQDLCARTWLQTLELEVHATALLNSLEDDGDNVLHREFSERVMQLITEDRIPIAKLQVDDTVTVPSSEAKMRRRSEVVKTGSEMLSAKQTKTGPQDAMSVFLGLNSGCKARGLIRKKKECNFAEFQDPKRLEGKGQDPECPDRPQAEERCGQLLRYVRAQEGQRILSSLSNELVYVWEIDWEAPQIRCGKHLKIKRELCQMILFLLVFYPQEPKAWHQSVPISSKEWCRAPYRTENTIPGDQFILICGECIRGHGRRRDLRADYSRVGAGSRTTARIQTRNTVMT